LVVDSHSILARWRNHFSYWIYMGLMMLGRQKYTQHNQVPLSLSWLFKS
jgi:hypothetical protein